jgi:hypothetical protein
LSVVGIALSQLDHTNLLDKARSEELDFNLVLTRYAMERILYGLSISEQRDQFLLKGTLLFDL